MVSQNGQQETIIEILEHALEREIDSFTYYVHAAETACDPQVKAFLLHLAEMEDSHRKQLLGQLSELRAQMEITESINSSFGGFED
ncbi:MAG: ferritin family protein [Bacteroidota bacterium]